MYCKPKQCLYLMMKFELYLVSTHKSNMDCEWRLLSPPFFVPAFLHSAFLNQLKLTVNSH